MADEQTVRKKYGCYQKALPFLIIERHALSPPAPQAGQEFKHCFIYVACASDSPTPIKGTLSRKVFFQGRLIFKDVSKVEIKSGKWADVAIIKTPPGTKPGDYNFRLSISIPKTTKTKKTSTTGELPFVIKK